jgi:muramoyltetrapeptide carboxypeptidase
MTYQKLKNGDVVDIIAPSSSRDIDLKAVENIVRGFNLIPRIQNNIIARGADFFSANTDEIRFDQLKQAIYAKDSKLIWSFRGGYGATRLIPKLLNLPLPIYPKILIGYSDITALHILCTQRYGWSTLHGRTLSEFVARDTDKAEISAMKEVLFGQNKVVFNNLKPLNKIALIDKEIKSEVIGGNLALIQTSLGTSWQFNADHKIILLEDVDERGYSIDRMLTHLSQAGIFDKTLAVIIGDIMCNPEKDGTILCDQAIARFANSLNIPVLSCPRIGHGKYNWPVPFNMAALLTLGKIPTLTIDTFR